MLNHKQTIRLQRRLSSREPFAVLRGYKNRDGPLIYHRRDGPQWYRFIGSKYSGTGPPDGTGPPNMFWNFSYFAKPERNSNAKPELKKEVKFEQEYLL